MGLPKYEKQIFWKKLHFFMHFFLKVELWALNNALSLIAILLLSICDAFVVR